MQISCMKVFLLSFPPAQEQPCQWHVAFFTGPVQRRGDINPDISITPTRMITVVVLDGSPQQSPSPPFPSGHHASSMALHTFSPNHAQSNSSMQASTGLARPTATPSSTLNAPEYPKTQLIPFPDVVSPLTEVRKRRSCRTAVAQLDLPPL